MSQFEKCIALKWRIEKPRLFVTLPGAATRMLARAAKKRRSSADEIVSPGNRG
jgi:hypothetical protein